MTATNVKEQDTFSRSNTSSTNPPHWGTASNGDSWTWNSLPVALVGTITSNQGTVTGTNALSSATLGTATSINTELLVRVSASDTLSNLGLTARGTTSYYYCQINSPNLEIGKRTGGTNTVLGSTAKTFNANTLYWMRFRVINTSAGTSCTLYFRSWASGSAEPTAWDVTVTGESSILTSGQMGIKWKGNTSGSSGTFDSFTATDASLIDYVSMRVLVRTQVSKSTSIRTKIRTQQTKSVPLRVRATIRSTLSTAVRALVSTKASRSIALRTKILTRRTASLVLRVPVSSKRKTLALPLRLSARTQRTKTIGLRVLAVTFVPEVAPVTTQARDGIMSTKARDGRDMTTSARDGMGTTHARDGEVSTAARDGKVSTKART